MENNTQPLIEVDQIMVERGGQLVIDGISLEVGKGEVLGILGQSGSGKSTILEAIAGFLPLKAGSINVNGQIGYCFQNNSLYRFMTIEENIAFGLEKLNKNQKKIRVNEILEQIGLKGMEKKYPSQLSGGQQQRVALGRAIAYRPTVLLLDEPFSALDIFTRDNLIAWVAALIKETQITTVLVSHYLDEALYLCNKIIVINGKRIIASLEVPFQQTEDRASIKFSEEFQAEKLKLQQLLLSAGDFS